MARMLSARYLAATNAEEPFASPPVKKPLPTASEKGCLAVGDKKREGVVDDKDRKTGGWMGKGGDRGSAGGCLNDGRGGGGETGNWQQKWGN